MAPACVAEVSSLKVSDIDSERMLLRIERGRRPDQAEFFNTIDVKRTVRSLNSGLTSIRRPTSVRGASQASDAIMTMQHGAPFFFAVEGLQRDNLAAPAVTMSLDFPLSSTVFTAKQPNQRPRPT
jgi:hypothetical protein